MKKLTLEPLNNPKNYAPLWYLIHKKGIEATTDQKKAEYAAFIRWLVGSLLCANCRNDATDFLQGNPPEMYFTMRDKKTGIEIGCFKHSWVFHNHVNAKLGKPVVELYDALVLYSNLESCTKCGKDGPLHIKTSRYTY